MSGNTIGKYAKAILGIGSALGIWAFTDAEIANHTEQVVVWFTQGFLFLSGLVNSFQAWTKTFGEKG